MTNTEFTKELTALLNRACRENDSDTPDYMLAEYLMDVLAAYEKAVSKRDEWWGLKPWAKASTPSKPEAVVESERQHTDTAVALGETTRERDEARAKFKLPALIAATLDEDDHAGSCAELKMGNGNGPCDCAFGKLRAALAEMETK